MKVDFELEIQHVAYMFIIAAVWLTLTGLAKMFLDDIFPDLYGGFLIYINICWAVGGIIGGGAILIAATTIY